MAENRALIEKDFIGCIPVLPSVAANFIDLTRQLNISKTSYANLLLDDPVLSSRIFSYINLTLNPSNSGYLSINKGISVMGLHGFKNIVIAFALFPAFAEASCIELYKYSLLTAYYSSSIAAQYNFINLHDAFLLGFLHDIGKLALKNKFGEKYPFCTTLSEDLLDSYSLEEEINKFGYCHTDISEFICKSWQLPVVVSDAIKYHHFPLGAMLPQASSVIFLADMLACDISSQNKEVQKVLQYMQLSKSDLAPYVDNSMRKLHPFFEILGI